MTVGDDEIPWIKAHYRSLNDQWILGLSVGVCVVCGGSGVKLLLMLMVMVMSHFFTSSFFKTKTLVRPDQTKKIQKNLLALSPFF